MENSDKKQVLHVDGCKSFGAAEGRENERRWDDKKIDMKNLDPDNHYDKTRQRLNFEVGPDGKIHPLGYQSKLLDQRLAERLDELGWHPFKEGCKNQPNCAAKFIFGGDHDRINEMAFGTQVVNLEKDADNSHIERMPEIEQWAKDIHQWLCKRYGAENVIGLEVHLDETSVHAHALVVPVGARQKSKTPHVMWAAKFGKNPHEYGEILREMHTSLHDEVNEKYGLDRGDSVIGRNVHHLNKKDYVRNLEKEARKAEKALKSLQTMIGNAQTEIAKQESVLSNIKDEVATGLLDAAEVEAKKAAAIKIIQEKEALIADKEAKIAQTKSYLTKLINDAKLAGAFTGGFRNPRVDVSPPQISTKPGLLQSFSDWKTEANKQLATEFWKAVNYVEKIYRDNAESQVKSAQNRQLVDYGELSKLREEVGRAESMLESQNQAFIVLIDQMLNPIVRGQVLVLAEALFSGEAVPSSSGGGGNDSDLRWDGRNPEEEEEAYHRRCLLAASAHVRHSVLRRGICR